MKRFALAFATVLALAVPAFAQSDTNLAAFRGLAAVSVLEATPAGKAALAANLTATGKIQDGTSEQPALQPFADQQQQALRDATSTVANARQLAEGLGTRLGGVYQTLATWSSTDNGKTVTSTNISPAVARVIAYAHRTSNSDSATAKSFLGDMTLPGNIKVSEAAAAILPARNGVADIFGRAYDLAAGTPGAGVLGNNRPFQTEPHLLTFRGKNIYGVPSHSLSYLVGPGQDLRANPSFPSGHTTYGFTQGVLLAILVPERYAEMVARAAEFGNSRIVLGAHYAMDVLGGRTLALYDLAHLLANAKGYVGVDRDGVKVDDFPKAVAEARADVVKVLEAACGGKLGLCARDDHGRFADPAKVQAFYESTQTYGLPVVYAMRAAPVDFDKVAPDAGHLLTAAFPKLSLKEANAILTATQGPGGGFLDDGSAFGVYSRLDLYRAGQVARDAKTR
ncbi:MAG: phosphatase PAP2 family protein [Rhodospirillaceae bacterium]|nr:phosphatase PAP2 family protein [Rhodospirillaceae bacterium]